MLNNNYRELNHELQLLLPSVAELNTPLIIRAPFKHYLPLTKIIIIGIGASSLVFKSVLPLITTANITYLDSIDPAVIEKFQVDLSTAYIFVSKSGNTHETMWWFEHITSLLQDRAAKNCLAITMPVEVQDTAAKSGLYTSAKRLGIEIIAHPKLSGRFSLFYLNMIMLKLLQAPKVLDTFIEGAKSCLGNLSQVSLWSSWYLASINEAYVCFNYSLRHKNLVLYFMQLFAESLGKNTLTAIPVYATGSLDEHSQLQLYLANPHRKLFRIFYNNTLDTLHLPIRKHVFMLQNLPNVAYQELAYDTFSLGRLCMQFMAEIINIALISNIDHATQPHVDKQKQYLS